MNFHKILILLALSFVLALAHPVGAVPEWNVASYITYIDYDLILKDKAVSYDVVGTWNDGEGNYLTTALGTLKLDYVSPVLKPVEEKSVTLGYRHVAPFSYSGTFRRIDTNDEILGQASAISLNGQYRGWFMSGSYSSYEKADATQLGVGYEHWFRSLSISSGVDFVGRSQIFNDGKPADYLSFSQDLQYYASPWTATTGYTLGKTALHVRGNGFLVNNSPDEQTFAARASIEFARKNMSVGYKLGYLSGEHYLSRASFTSLAHTLKFNVQI